LENYKHVEQIPSSPAINLTGSLSQSLSTNSDLSHSLSSLSSSHPNLFVTPLSNSLPENGSSHGGNSTGGSDHIGLRIGSFPNLITPSRTTYHDRARGLLPTFPIKGENTPTESEDDSDLSEGSDDDNPGEGKRRSANASLPLSNEQQSKKTNLGSNQPKKKTKNESFPIRSFRENLSARKIT